MEDIQPVLIDTNNNKFEEMNSNFVSELHHLEHQGEVDHNSVSSEESNTTRKNRKGSLIKNLVNKNKAVFISLDLEHRGNKCGVTQLSAVLFKMCGFEAFDIEKDLVITEVFNDYVRPHMSAIWNPRCE